MVMTLGFSLLSKHELQQMDLLSHADDEESKVIQCSSPIHLAISNNQKEEPISCNDLHFSLPSPKILSTWVPSPPQSPASPLLYHCIASLHRHEGIVFSIAVSNGIVFTGSESNRIRAWTQPDCADRGCLKSSSGQVRAILVHGNTLFSARRDGRIRVWDFKDSDKFFRVKKITTFPRKMKTQFLQFSKSSTQLFQSKKDYVSSCMAYYHAEGLLYTASSDKVVKVFRVLDKKCVDSFVAHDDGVNCIVVSQDDGCVFTCANDGSVKIWRRICERETSHILTSTLKFQQSPVNALALSSCSSNLVLYSGSSDGVINFWEKEKLSGKFNHGGFLQGHKSAVLCLVAIDRFIFSGSEDTTIRIWRREEGSCFHECLGVLDGHRGPVRCLAACLEMEKFVMGFLVYSAGLDQNFKVWRVKVFPEEKMCLSFAETKNDAKMTRTIDFQMSPVLSPSWVEKKLNG